MSSDPKIADGVSLAAELAREISARHILFGVPVKAIARRVDCDDVLFELLDGSLRVAVVHLTYAVETDPQWPHTEMFENYEHFASARMASDHEAL